MKLDMVWSDLHGALSELMDNISAKLLGLVLHGQQKWTKPVEKNMAGRLVRLEDGSQSDFHGS